MVLFVIRPCFNPLHCGAVVASTRCSRRSDCRKLFQSPSLRGSGRFQPCSARTRPRSCFNPLHCGAVVASSWEPDEVHALVRVSIPFIAGQWSLRGNRTATDPAGGWFQSPSLRGSGRFAWDDAATEALIAAFQSPSLRGSGRFARSWPQPPTRRSAFQSPSLRGSGRFVSACSTSS